MPQDTFFPVIIRYVHDLFESFTSTLGLRDEREPVTWFERDTCIQHVQYVCVWLYKLMHSFCRSIRARNCCIYV